MGAGQGRGSVGGDEEKGDEEHKRDINGFVINEKSSHETGSEPKWLRWMMMMMKCYEITTRFRDSVDL